MPSPEKPRQAQQQGQPRGAVIPSWPTIALAVLFFALGTTCLNLVVPTDSRGELGIRRRMFGNRAGQIDMVFLGSSHVQRAFDCEVVEAELAAAGIDLQTFNFGVPGMRALEQDHVLRQVLAQPSDRLRWIVLEAGPIGIAPRKDTDDSFKGAAIDARSIEWHTLRSTHRALAAIWRSPLRWRERLELAMEHVSLWARNASNLGLLSERLFESSSARAQREWREARARVAADDGPEAANPPDFLKRVRADSKRASARGKRGPDRYRELLEAVEAQNRTSIDLAHLDLELLAEGARAARQAGVELLFVTVPSDTGSPEALRLQEAGWLRPLLHFNDPGRYPRLFEKELRRDPKHLNPEGAELFSRLFARAFIALQEEGE